MSKTWKQRKCPTHDDCQIVSLNGGPWKHMPKSEVGAWQRAEQ